jgi:hypothetical protein
LGGWAFLALPNSKLYAVTFCQTAEPGALDSGMMYKNILSTVALDKAVAFLIAEPLDCTIFSLTHF